MEKRQGCIYHAVNGKGYVGQHCTTYARRRWKRHWYDAVAGSSLPFHRALRKHTCEGFSWEIIWVGPVSKLNEMETKFIKKLHTFVDDSVGGGYNLRSHGEVVLVSKSTRKKMSEGVRRRYAQDPTFRVRVGLGVKRAIALDPSIRERMRERRRSHSQSTKRKQSRNKLAFYAAHPERRLECGDSLRGKSLSVEHRKKLSAAAKRRAKTKEGRAHLLRNSKKGAAASVIARCNR